MQYLKTVQLEIVAEKDIAENFEEEWVDTAQVCDRKHLMRKRPLRRVHGGIFGVRFAGLWRADFRLQQNGPAVVGKNGRRQRYGLLLRDRSVRAIA